MSLTTDPNDPGLRKIRSDGMQETYLVLSDEERAKGFVRPVRYKYRHLACGSTTTMGLALCETYARDPKFYGGTFCCGCGKHFSLQTGEGWQFEWEPDGDPVGSDAKEAEQYLLTKRLREIPTLTQRREQRIKAAKAELEAALASPEWSVRCCCECSADYVCDLQNKQDDPVFCPKCRKKP